MLLPVPAFPTMNTECRTSNSSCSWTTCNHDQPSSERPRDAQHYVDMLLNAYKTQSVNVNIDLKFRLYNVSKIFNVMVELKW